MRTRFLSLSILLFAISTLNAQSIEQTILKLSEHNKTYVAEFTETHAMPKLKKEIKKQGTMYFSAPGSLLMDYTDPQGDYSLIYSGKFTASRRGNVQSFPMNSKTKSQMYVLRETLLGSMMGDLKRVAEENEAEIECTEQGNSYVCVLTKQKAKAVGVNRLELVYDKKTGELKSLKLLQANGNYQLYETQNGKLNVAIAEATWNK